MKTTWLRSVLRRQLLALKYYYLAKWLGNSAKAEVYLALHDPYSFMLVQVLDDLAKRYDIQFKLYLVYQAVPGTTMAPELMQRWALKDANFIAAQYGLIPVDAYPNAKALLTGQQLWQLSKQSITTAVTIFQQTWFDQFDSYYSSSTPVINFQVKNLYRLVARGHYQPASIFFAGEWFLGIDRLNFLERQLSIFGLAKKGNEIKYCANRVQLPANNAPHTRVNGELEVFLSLRSPYSYLGFIKAKRLAQHYQIPLVVKPVLPLMIRGFDVSLNKQKYLYLDAYREAQLADINFKRFVDPLGKGITHCYQIFSYANSQGKAIDYIEHVFQAIYVDGLDVAKKSVLEAICRTIGLDYQQALLYSQRHDWQLWVDNHQIELESMDLWGVPCFRFQNTCVWGQDRLAQIEQALLNIG